MEQVHPKIRVDDFPAGIPNRPYSVFDLSLLWELEKRQLPYYLGVVPELTSKYDFHVLKQFKHAVIAMHGFNHAFDRWRPKSEFDALSKEVMHDKMQWAISWFGQHGITTNTFVPPFNMFNQDLLDELNQMGFKYITGGPETENQMDASKLNFGRLQLLMSCGKHYTSYGVLDDILKGLSELPVNETITLHLCGEYKICNA